MRTQFLRSLLPADRSSIILLALQGTLLFQVVKSFPAGGRGREVVSGSQSSQGRPDYGYLDANDFDWADDLSPLPLGSLNNRQNLPLPQVPFELLGHHNWYPHQPQQHHYTQQPNPNIFSSPVGGESSSQGYSQTGHISSSHGEPYEYPQQGGTSFSRDVDSQDHSYSGQLLSEEHSIDDEDGGGHADNISNESDDIFDEQGARTRLLSELMEENTLGCSVNNAGQKEQVGAEVESSSRRQRTSKYAQQGGRSRRPGSGRRRVHFNESEEEKRNRRYGCVVRRSERIRHSSG